MADIIPFRRPEPASAPETLYTKSDYEEDVLAAAAASILDDGNMCIEVDDGDDLVIEARDGIEIRVPEFTAAMDTLMKKGIDPKQVGREIGREVMSRSGIQHDVPPTGVRVMASGGVS